MKTYFREITVNLGANQTRPESLPFNTLKVVSVSGTILLRLENGEWLRARSRDVFEAMPDEQWSLLELRADASGGTITLLVGLGSFGGGAGGGGGQLMTGPSNNPGGDGIYPDDRNELAVYYNHSAGQLFVWNTQTQQWD